MLGGIAIVELLWIRFGGGVMADELFWKVFVLVLTSDIYRTGIVL